MEDRHIHIEKGPYTKEWLQQFIDQAMERNIDRIYILEHSYRFDVFKPAYEPIRRYEPCGEYMRSWLDAKLEVNLDEYLDFVARMREEKFDIDVKFGLEVCWIPESEAIIRNIVSGLDLDFVTGSVHFINGFGFDHRKSKYHWEELDVDQMYLTYYEDMIRLVESGLFTNLAHPDSIKCFGYKPSIDLDDLYAKLADKLVERKMTVEFNNGLYINYGIDELGTNRQLLKILLDKGAQVVTASDAHMPENVGKYIKEAEEIISSLR